MNSVVNSAFLGSDCVGRTIDGTFTLLRWLGGTEQSSVFLTQLDPAHKAAIKFIPANAPDAYTRSAQWSTAGALSHPRLVRVFGTGRCEVDGVDLLYIVTEYADEVLSEILLQRPLTPAETREMLDPVLDALASLHTRNLVHGHLKPSNVMVVNDQLKLSTDRLHTVDEPPSASPSNSKYDAPEIALGQMSPASDVWSLGVVIGEALTQRPRLSNGSAVAESVVHASIPPPFFGIVRECMRLDPAHRSTLTAVRDALGAAPAANPAGKTPASPPPTDPPSTTLPSKTPAPKAKALIAGGVIFVGALIAALIVGYQALSSRHQSSSPAARQSAAPVAQPQSPPPIAKTPSVAPPAQPPSQAAAPPSSPNSAAPAQSPAQSPVQAAQSASPANQPPPPSEDAQPPSSGAEAPPPSAAPATEPASAPQAKPAQASATGPVVKGEVASQSSPDVPQHIRDTIQGHIRVRVALQVDASGNVADATLDSPGPSQYFANQALKAARAWKFKPAQVDSRAVASTWTLQFSFGHDATTITPAETTP